MIQNFRELHLYPLMLMKNHLARAAAKVDKDKKILVARRLKRLSTIIDKLERPSLDGGRTSNAIKLTRMQDV
ncbi:GTP pyrophosphokinase, partial [Escherichia coli]